MLPRPDVEPIWAGASARALAKAGVAIDVVQETDTKIALLGLIAAGVGLSVVSGSMRRLGREGVVFRELVDLAVALPLTTLSTRAPSPRAATWLALAREVSGAAGRSARASIGIARATPGRRPAPARRGA